MAVVIVVALVVVVMVISLAVCCRLYSRHKLSDSLAEPQCEDQAATAASAVHQKLLWPGMAVTNMEDLLYEKRPVESHSTPLHPAGHLPHPVPVNNNLTNIYHVVRPNTSNTYFRREHSHQVSAR